MATMFGLAYASFPLYKLFCQITGYGGTPQIAADFSEYVGDRIIKVRFNADVAPNLPWIFKPLQKEIEVKVGENKMAFFMAENKSDRPIKGMATYNVTPDKAGYYFNKVQCFCFDEQILQPYEKVEMPVSFYIDPEIEGDIDADDVKTVTLSYTFFESKE